MFEHLTIYASDRDGSARFYDTVLRTVGVARTGTDEECVRWQDFWVCRADGGRVTRRLHVGFVAPSRAHVDEFWRAGTDAGYRDDGAPGPRPEYGDDYYGGFLLDPDGNSAEAVHHDSLRAGGIVDHVWLRVADVGAAKRFYAPLAPRAGYRMQTDTQERVQFAGSSGSFSVVAGTPSENVHLAFPATDPALLADPDRNTVELVHRPLAA